MKRKNKKIIAVVLAAALFLTGMPEFSAKQASAAETSWKVLGEEDLPVDELYGWWYPDDYSSGQKDVMIGRKDGKIVLMDGDLQLVKETEYDQIEYAGEKGSSVDFLVSHPVDSGKEYASFDRTGKITVQGIYKKVEDIGWGGEKIFLYAEKVNGECGFRVDGKEIGFDKKFVDKPEGAIVTYSYVVVGENTYYVKQYFETEDVYDEVGGFYGAMSSERMQEKLQSEQCEFIFYNEAGKVVDGETLIAECERLEKEKEEQRKQDTQVIAELKQTAVSQLPIREYINNTWKTSTGKYMVNDVTAYRFGDGYLAYVKADVEFNFEGYKEEDPYYFAGFFDRDKTLVKFGQVIAARNENYWDEGIYLAIRDNDKKIYFYGDDDYANTGNMVKYLYTDADGTFTEAAYDLPSAYPSQVVLEGDGKYLVAAPMYDFAATTCMYTDLEGKNALKAEYAILDETNGTKKAVFYDSKWKEIKSIDVSRINGDIQLCDGVVLGRSCALLYKTKGGYYGLIGMDGSIAVDAEQEKYTYGSVEGSYYEKFHVRMKKGGEYYYYYGEDFLPHTEEEYEDWEAKEDDENDENEYGDITYTHDYLYDEQDEVIGVCEKVTDQDGKVIVNHEIKGEAYERDRGNGDVYVSAQYVYIFKDCKSIVVVDRHWNGKRGDGTEEATATPKQTEQPTASPTATSDVTPSAPPFSGTLSNPRVGSGGVTTWDCVYFGNYWQEDTNGDGRADKKDEKTPIKWRVLSVDGNDAFLLADKNLDVQRYNDAYTEVTWETCTMRSWLNGYGAEANQDGKDYSDNNFLDNAFSKSEQSAIRITNVVNDDNPYHGTEGGNDTSDKVYLLSINEVKNPVYGFSPDSSKGGEGRRAKNTEYAKAQGAPSGEYAGNSWWWLRSPGYDSHYASLVILGGNANGGGVYVYNPYIAARAALHLDLSADSGWSYAGTVASDEGDSETTTPSPSPTATVTPTKAPTAAPAATATPTLKPTQTPIPTLKPIAEPIFTPSDSPKPSATVTPDLEPTTEPADQPTEQPQAPSDPAPIQPPSQVTTPSGPVPAAPTAVTKPEQDEDDDESDDDDFEDEDEKLKKGSYFMSGNFGYKVTKLKKKKGEVAVVCVKSKNSKAYVIPDKVKKQGITFTVSSIQANAFQGCKKAKTLNMKAVGIKAIGKKALNGLNKKIQIKVPKKKLWVYRKMLQKCGYRVIRS